MYKEIEEKAHGLGRGAAWSCGVVPGADCRGSPGPEVVRRLRGKHPTAVVWHGDGVALQRPRVIHLQGLAQRASPRGSEPGAPCGTGQSGDHSVPRECTGVTRHRTGLARPQEIGSGSSPLHG